jgi:hypothetical protein
MLNNLPITSLHIYQTTGAVKSSKPIGTNVNLNKLLFWDCPSLSDISDLANLKLSEITLRNTGLKDLKPLSQMKSLKKLSIDRNTLLSDITGITELELDELKFSPEFIRRGMKELRNMTSLQSITPVKSKKGGGYETLPDMSPEEFWQKYDNKEFR